jgi:Papain-like cysteine protease AvrRpt2
LNDRAIERGASANTPQIPRSEPLSVAPQAAQVLALQRSAGNQAVTAMLQPERRRLLARCAGPCTCGGQCAEDDLLDGLARQATHALIPRSVAPPVLRPLQRQAISDPFEQIDLRGQPGKYMLKPPKAIKQHALTCWAAALSSFLQVVGAQRISFEDIISRYIGTACIDTFNTLDQNHADEVFAEWGVSFEFFEPPHPQLTGAQWRQKLREHGHLLLATRHAMGHVVVVYGSGYDDKGAPNPDWISVMDPIVGGHRNWHVSSVPNTISVGWLTGARTRPAPCLSQPGPPPPPD